MTYQTLPTVKVVALKLDPDVPPSMITCLYMDVYCNSFLMGF